MRVIFAPMLLLALQAWAQPSFLVKHALPPNTVIRSSDLAADGGLVLAGGIDDDLIYIDRLDAAGNRSWTQALDVFAIYGGFDLDDHEPAYANGVACMPNGDIILAGVAGEWDQDIAQFPTRHYVLMDNEGGIRQDRLEYYPTRSENWQGVLPLPNGNVVLYGSYPSLNLIFGYIVLYDPETDQVVATHRFYRTGTGEENTYDLLSDLIAADDGFIGIGTDLIIRFSADLQPLWHTYFDAAGIQGVDRASDGTIMLAWPDKVMRLSDDGTQEWTMSIPTGMGTVTSIRAGADGSVYVAGTGTDGSIWWGEMDAQGQLSWQEQWGEQDASYVLQGLHLQADGRLSMVAQTLSPEPVVAILTTDTTGRLEGCSVSGSPSALSTGSVGVLSYGLSIQDLGGGVYNADTTRIDQTPIYTLSTEQCESGFGRLSGSVYHDLNTNGTMDPEDDLLAWQPVLVTPDQSYAYSTLQGYEVDLLTTGTRTISLVHNEAIWGLSAGAGGHVVEVTQVDTTIIGIDFGLFALLDTAIVQSALTSAPTRCSMLIPQTINVLNQGTTTPDVLVALTMDPLITFMSSVPAPDSIAGDTIYWHLDDLPLFEQASITLQMLMPDFSAIGVELQATVRCYEVLVGGGFADLNDNVWNSTLTCSYDPNDKRVEPAGDGPAGHIPPDTEWLTYTVRFQNTGNDTAFAVVIRDQLSPLLQRGTFEVLATSHTLTQLTLSSGGLAVFHFDNILLPDSGTNEQASHGYVRFRIRPLADLAHGTVIQNTAGIYFDLNPPVVTNTVLNTVQFCADTFALEVTLIDGMFNITGNFGPWASSVWDLFLVDWYLNGEPLGLEWEGIPELPGSYTAILTRYTTGCIYETGPYVFIATGLQNEEASAMHIAPNPFNERLLIRYPGFHDHLELVDVNGRVVLSRSTGNATTVYVEREWLAAGIYLVRMMQGTTVVAAARVVAQ